MEPRLVIHGVTAVPTQVETVWLRCFGTRILLVTFGHDKKQKPIETVEMVWFEVPTSCETQRTDMLCKGISSFVKKHHKPQQRDYPQRVHHRVVGHEA